MKIIKYLFAFLCIPFGNDLYSEQQQQPKPVFQHPLFHAAPMQHPTRQMPKPNAPVAKARFVPVHPQPKTFVAPSTTEHTLPVKTETKPKVEALRKVEQKPVPTATGKAAISSQQPKKMPAESKPKPTIVNTVAKPKVVIEKPSIGPKATKPPVTVAAKPAGAPEHPTQLTGSTIKKAAPTAKPTVETKAPSATPRALSILTPAELAKKRIETPLAAGAKKTGVNKTIQSGRSIKETGAQALSIWDSIGGWFSDRASDVSSGVQSGFNFLKNAVSKTPSKVGQSVENIANEVDETAKTVAAAVKKEGEKTVGAVKTGVETAVAKAGETAKTGAAAVKQGTETAVTKVAETAKTAGTQLVAKTHVVDLAKQAQAISKVPSQAAKAIASNLEHPEQLAHALAQNIKSGAIKAAGAIQTVGDKTHLTKVGKQAIGNIASSYNGTINTLQDIANKTGKPLTQVVGPDMIKAWNTAVEQTKKYGPEVGMKTLMGAVTGAITGCAASAAGGCVFGGAAGFTAGGATGAALAIADIATRGDNSQGKLFGMSVGGAVGQAAIEGALSGGPQGALIGAIIGGGMAAGATELTQVMPNTPAGRIATTASIMATAGMIPGAASKNIGRMAAEGALGATVGGVQGILGETTSGEGSQIAQESLGLVPVTLTGHGGLGTKVGKTIGAIGAIAGQELARTPLENVILPGKDRGQGARVVTQELKNPPPHGLDVNKGKAIWEHLQQLPNKQAQQNYYNNLSDADYNTLTQWSAWNQSNQ